MDKGLDLSAKHVEMWYAIAFMSFCPYGPVLLKMERRPEGDTDDSIGLQVFSTFVKDLFADWLISRSDIVFRSDRATISPGLNPLLQIPERLNLYLKLSKVGQSGHPCDVLLEGLLFFGEGLLLQVVHFLYF